MSVLGTIILWIVAVGAPIAAGYLIYLLIKQKEKADEILDRDCVVLSILVPKNNEKTPLAAEQMFAALHGILKPGEESEHVSFEIASVHNATGFYIHVPRRLKDFIEGQIYAQYPSVEIKEVDDYAQSVADDLVLAGTELSLSREDVYPIRTFLNFEVDPLAGITSVLAKVRGDEKIWVQMLIKPIDDKWQDRGVEVVKAMKAGVPLSGSLWADFKSTVKDIGKEIPKTIMTPPATEKKEKKEEKEEKKLSGPEETAMTAIETKIQKIGFETKIRILALADNEDTAREALIGVVGVFKQFSTTNLNSFAVGSIVTERDILQVFKLRNFGDKGNIFNVEELASIYHFPHVSVETPSIVWAGSKKGEPPANLPIEGKIPSQDLTVFAETNYRNYQYKFGLKMNDRRLHSYIIGKTGTGKSNLLKTMIIDDIREGRGVAVVDPHGDLIKAILDFIPEERIKDVVYFNPADSGYPIGFNLLESVEPDLKNIIASGLMSVFTKIWANVWSARMEYILRNTILALLEYPNATFLGIMRLLGDKTYRRDVLEHVKDPVIRDFFLNEYEKYDPKFRNEAIAPIQNKVGQFLSSTVIRNIVGQPKSTINMSEIMDMGKIFLIDLTIGKIGEDNSALLGAMMITKIQLAAMQRADIAEEERRDFYLYVDEFQNFATESFAVILSEARKYHLNLVLTNQYIAQMPEVVSDAIFGNIGTMVSFRVGAKDADALVKEFEPVFDANDLVNLANYHIYIKMAIDGVTCPAFSAMTLPPLKENYGFRNQVIELSRRVYGRPREAVEAEIARWSEEDSSEGVAKEEGGIKFKEIKDKNNNSWYEVQEKKIAVSKEPGSQSKPQVSAEDSHSLISTNEAHEVAKGTYAQSTLKRAEERSPDQTSIKGAVTLPEGETVKILNDNK